MRLILVLVMKWMSMIKMCLHGFVMKKQDLKLWLDQRKIALEWTIQSCT